MTPVAASPAGDLTRLATDAERQWHAVRAVANAPVLDYEAAPPLRDLLSDDTIARGIPAVK